MFLKGRGCFVEEALNKKEYQCLRILGWHEISEEGQALLTRISQTGPERQLGVELLVLELYSSWGSLGIASRTSGTFMTHKRKVVLHEHSGNSI